MQGGPNQTHVEGNASAAPFWILLALSVAAILLSLFRSLVDGAAWSPVPAFAFFAVALTSLIFILRRSPQPPGAGGNAFRFGANGAVLPDMSDDMRETYENPTYDIPQRSPKDRRRLLIQGTACFGVSVALGLMLPAGLNPGWWPYGASAAIFVLGLIDTITAKRRGQVPGASFRWADMDTLGRTVCGLLTSASVVWLALHVRLLLDRLA